MSERLIFVESNTTGTGILALATAQRLGLEPLLLTGSPDRYVGLADTGAEVMYCDTNTFDALLGTVARLPDTVVGVTTTSEFYLAASAALAGRLGLPGNPPEAVRLCRNKATMRAVLDEAGVDQPRFVAVRDHQRLTSALRHVGLPCVVKPVDESGSQDVRLCRFEAQVRAQVRRVLAARVNARGQRSVGVALIEEYLEAPEYSVEMFHTGGVAHCVGVTAKQVTDGPFFVESGHHYPADLDPATASVLVSTVTKALEVVGIREGPTHTEVKLLPERAAIIEINARLAGGMIPELIRMVDGVDLVAQQIRASVGLPVELAPVPGGDRCVGIRFVTAHRAGQVREVSGVERVRTIPAVRDAFVRIGPGDLVTPAENAYHRVGHVIAAGLDPAAVDATLDSALNQIRITTT
ncbi:MAG TPA: ATP-grasp domain-containing protein [Pseudonocardiaceae bacterium]|nr:ATP-grasp domain-containing protein [Pseudonocardiaceae bacterium]